MFFLEIFDFLHTFYFFFQKIVHVLQINILVKEIVNKIFLNVLIYNTISLKIVSLGFSLTPMIKSINVQYYI